MRVRSGIFAILWVLAACSPQPEPGARTTTQRAPQHRRAPSPAPLAPTLPATPGRYLAISSVPHLAFSTPADPPATKPAADSDVVCDSRSLMVSVTPGGKLLQGRGWHIVSEEKLGPLDAVAIVRRTIPSIRIMCPVEDGRIAIFAGERLIAILAASKRSKSVIAWLERLDNGTLRVWPSLAEPPIGDLKLTGSKVELLPTAARDSICRGKAIVPNIFGKPIWKARRLMIAAGWEPVPAVPAPKPSEEDYHHYVRDGIVEVSQCSRFDARECRFAYRSRGVDVTVITAIVGTMGRPVVYYNPWCDVPSGKYAPYSTMDYYSHYP